MALRRRRPQRSLRTILTVLFLLFSIVPLAFVTYYSVVKYEKAIDYELSERLLGNAREIMGLLDDYQTGMQQRASRFLQDPSLVYHISVGDVSGVRSVGQNWMRSDVATSLTFFTRNGRMILSFFKDATGGVREFVPSGGSALILSNENLEKLKPVKEYAFVEHGKDKLSLIRFTKIFSSSGRVVGYVEQTIDLDRAFLSKLKQKMKLEVLVSKSNGSITVATNDDFVLYKDDFLKNRLNSKDYSFFERSIRAKPFGFILTPVSWGNSDFVLGFGASKAEAKAVLKNVNYAFYTVVGAVGVLLIVTIFLTSNAILAPLEELLGAIQNIQSSDQSIEIPVRSKTEIGLLTESFNEMSRSVSRARSELKSKIAELETINKELVDTQARLVHSSKMVSLGQLVAGVAHELNNPIGFIYSNMTHLRDYGQKLIHLVDRARTESASVQILADEYDLEYIKQDMPKLITSCEDGARRTRDIVLGLRNFSRLEEAKVKEIDLNEAIDNTLNLLAGEIKNRIQVHKTYSKSLPLVSCYASQINQVLMNLLSNATQAIQGSGNIWITTEMVKEPASTGPAVTVSIQDSGQGIPPEVIEKIFDPFFSTKGVGQGTGLGLSISYGIIQSHGGMIEVKSQVGIGTEFRVTIPVRLAV